MKRVPIGEVLRQVEDAKADKRWEPRERRQDRSPQDERNDRKRFKEEQKKER